MAAAIPAAMIVASSTRAAPALRCFALVAVVFPWQGWTPDAQVAVLEVGAVAAAVLIATRTRPMVIRWTAASFVALSCVAVDSAFAHVSPGAIGPPTVVAPLATNPADLASANWAASVTRDHGYSTPQVRDVTEKVPVWLGLLVLVGIGIAYSVKPGTQEHGAAIVETAA